MTIIEVKFNTVFETQWKKVNMPVSAEVKSTLGKSKQSTPVADRLIFVTKTF